MALSTAEIEAVVRDLKPKLEGGRIERIDQREQHELILSVRKGKSRYWLLISAHPQFSRLHLLTSRPGRPKPARGFCNVVRQHLTGVPIELLRQVPNDRVVVFECESRDSLMRPRRLTLLAELVSVGSNMLLVDESNRILAVLFREQSARRTLVPGLEYQPLAPPVALPEKARANRFEYATDEGDPLALSRAIQAHYGRLEIAEALKRQRTELLGAIRVALKSRRRRLRKVEDQFGQAQNAESIRRKGEVLKMVLPQVQRGQREVTVEDPFDPGGPPLTIQLDPALSPVENLSRIFGRYKKAKAGREKLADRLAQTQREIAAIEAVEGSARAADSAEELAALKIRAQEAGVRFPKHRPRTTGREQPRGPRAFRSADGLEILVARNSRENERLTFSIARGNDYWMHVLGWPGPHVVIRKPSDRSISRDGLLDAAQLAVHFSKIRGTDYAQVAYTQCKHVRRMKGAPSGTVSYAHTTTLPVRVSRARLERLLRKPDEPTSTGGPVA